MSEKLRHRGPDDKGVWLDPQTGVALGQRRLSIVDLSPAGHQPMLSQSGRYVIVFNGEIYNHASLRLELDSGYSIGLSSKESPSDRWRGRSDTETLLAGIEVWGLEETLRRSVGMFSIAVWDRCKRELVLARDRFGEKPLYYGWLGSGDERAIVFGSELKALRAFSTNSPELSLHALAGYFQFMNIPAPYTIYEGVYKLQAGCLLTINNSSLNSIPRHPVGPQECHGGVHVKRWWCFKTLVETSLSNTISDKTSIVNEVESRLKESVMMQAQADVPLGAFLSGGIDSSCIVALMQNCASRPIKTFTIGFDESEFDETSHASKIACLLGTDHSSIRVTAHDVQNVIPKLPAIYDEPFADASQIPTYLVCKAARGSVAVALSGDGGDELFGGYNRHKWGPKIFQSVSRLPSPLRFLILKTLSNIPLEIWKIMSRHRPGIPHIGERIGSLATALLESKDLDEFYIGILSIWRQVDKILLNTDANGRKLIQDSSAWCLHEIPDSLDPVHRVMYHDTLNYLPNVILTKLDRASMACSLETRVPFLDHRVVELAWRLPLNMNHPSTLSKWPLREVLLKHIPSSVINRPKSGFAIPVGQWLRGPLRDWAEELISDDRLKSDGFLNIATVRETWHQHLIGNRDYTGKLWTVLMFQSWLRNSAC